MEIICYTCKTAKPEDEYHWQVRGVKRKGVCKECHRAYRRAHYLENQQKYIDKAKAWTAAQGGRIQEKYRLDPKAFEALRERHSGLCWACREAPGQVVDHDHGCCASNTRTCGKCVRGWLCHPCNKGLGFFRDDPKRLQAAIDYLNG